MRATATNDTPNLAPRARPGIAGLVLVAAGILATGLDAEAGSWRNRGPSGGYVRALAQDPQNASVLYAAALRSGVYKSVNGGSNWFRSSDGLNGLVTKLVIDPNDSNVVYAGAFSITGARGGLLFKSTNAGATWTMAAKGLAATGGVEALAADPNTPNRLILGPDPYIDETQATPPNALYISVDAGATWTRRLTGANPEAGYLDLVFDAAHPGTIYATDNVDGLRKSTDNGQTWPLKSSVIRGVVTIDPNDPNTLYACGPDGMNKSTNGGDSWQTLGGPSACERAVMHPSSSSVIYSGRFKSTDAGATWTQILQQNQTVAHRSLQPEHRVRGRGSRRDPQID